MIGSGPAGFYATGMLLKAGFAVDLYDVLPTPFGLVRAGVAPDHPNIKAVTRVFEKTAGHEAFRFFGGVELGVNVSREQLLDHYHAVVYAMGTNDDNRLSIPGEDLPGSHPATEFVAWYNGHPHQMLVCTPTRSARPTRRTTHGRARDLVDQRGRAAGPPRAGPGRVHQPGAARARGAWRRATR